MARLVLQQPGEVCARIDDGEHFLRAPEDDTELQSVLGWLKGRPVADLYTESIRAAIDYVLDGARTGRFDLLSPEVHPGERASVGAKLEYEVLRTFNLEKAKPLDTKIADVPVDIKATVGDNWAIPKEAQCQLCICTQIQVGKSRHRSWLVRTHRSWLYRGKGNNDGKRGLAVEARDRWSVPLYDWANLPVNPLRYLTEGQVDRVLAKRPGQEQRMLMMFRYLEGRVIPRSIIETVGAGKQDPLKRARAIREPAAREGLTLLCGSWVEERDLAAAHGIALSIGEWVALRTAECGAAAQQPPASEPTPAGHLF